MDTGLLDNPTRKRILLALKKNGSMSVDDLSDEVKITPMGVRQHLLILERNGAVEYVTRKRGVGRPGFLYRLTETADDLFPKSYQTFALDILTELELLDGRGKIDAVFRKRKERIASEMMRLMSGKKTVSERVHFVADLLQKDGFIVDLEENVRTFKLKQFNCPISKVAYRFKEACAHDLQLFRELFGEAVTREQCLSDGDQSCVYAIPKSAGTLPE